jgi:hypothetical protein
VQDPSRDSEELPFFDVGMGHTTNKRFTFDGSKRNASTRHSSSILALTPFADGFAIEKATGRSPILVIDGDADIMTVIFAEALSRS